MEAPPHGSAQDIVRRFAIRRSMGYRRQRQLHRAVRISAAMDGRARRNLDRGPEPASRFSNHAVEAEAWHHPHPSGECPTKGNDGGKGRTLVETKMINTPA